MAEWIDVTRPLTHDLIGWPGDPPFELRRISHITGPNTCNLSEIRTSLHVGTHLDAPLHFIPDGLDVADLPLWRLCGPATVVVVEAQRDVQPDDLAKANVTPGDRVLLRTANESLWRERVFNEGFFAISGDAAQWLAQAHTPLVGIDYLSADGYRTVHKAAHYALLGAGIPIIEGLDLSAVAPGRYELVALPLRIPGGDGSPARVVLRPLPNTLSLND
ncbi:MAG: cyclase family protein [Phycisphaerae bacterium]|nr:cyclase family protein [Phycisphaerae bacterium]